VPGTTLLLKILLRAGNAQLEPRLARLSLGSDQTRAFQLRQALPLALQRFFRPGPHFF
jgi:hypothetical protein